MSLAIISIKYLISTCITTTFFLVYSHIFVYSVKNFNSHEKFIKIKTHPSKSFKIDSIELFKMLIKKLSFLLFIIP